MKQILTITCFFILSVLISSCTTSTDEIDRNAEIENIAKAIDSTIGWAKEKDLDLLFSIIANDSSYLSVHPSSNVVRGFEAFKQNVPFWMDPEFQYVKHNINDLTINLSENAKVAWFYCVLNDRNTFKGEPANWLNARWTGVLEKRENNWVIVQQHFSFANDE